MEQNQENDIQANSKDPKVNAQQENQPKANIPSAPLMPMQKIIPENIKITQVQLNYHQRNNLETDQLPKTKYRQPQKIDQERLQQKGQNISRAIHKQKQKFNAQQMNQNKSPNQQCQTNAFQNQSQVQNINSGQPGIPAPPKLPSLDIIQQIELGTYQKKVKKYNYQQDESIKKQLNQAVNYSSSIQAVDVPRRKDIESYGWVRKQEPVFQFSYDSQPQNIQEFQWKDVLGCVASDSGSSGVIFITFTNKRSLVVKGSQYLASEYLAQILFKLLGVNCPDYKLIEYAEEEYSTMKKYLKISCYCDIKVLQKVRIKLNSPYLSLQEYIPCLPFNFLGPHKAQICLETGTNAPQILRQIGIIMASDIFINNGDRVPTIWYGPGNANNLIIQISGEVSNQDLYDGQNLNIEFVKAVAIDSKTACISSSLDKITRKNLEKILNKIDKFLGRMFEQYANYKSGQPEEFQCMDKVMRFVENNTFWQIPQKSLVQIIEGMIFQFQKIAEIEQQKLKEIEQQVVNFPKIDYDGIWSKGLSGIDSAFLILSSEIISKHVTRNNQ